MATSPGRDEASFLVLFTEDGSAAGRHRPGFSQMSWEFVLPMD